MRSGSRILNPPTIFYPERRESCLMIAVSFRFEMGAPNSDFLAWSRRSEGAGHWPWFVRNFCWREFPFESCSFTGVMKLTESGKEKSKLFTPLTSKPVRFSILLRWSSRFPIQCDLNSTWFVSLTLEDWRPWDYGKSDLLSPAAMWYTVAEQHWDSEVHHYQLFGMSHH